MIVVTVEVWPGGNPLDKVLKGKILIDNSLETSIRSGGGRGDYRVRVHKQRGKYTTVRVFNYPRKAYHVWELVRRALNEWAKTEGRGAKTS